MTCPGNNDDSKTFMNVCVDEEGREVGRDFRFGTRIKAGDQAFPAGTGGGFEVLEEYRKEGIGADFMMKAVHSNEYDFFLVGGMTPMVYPMYRKLKYHIFELPQYIKVLDAKYALKRYALKGTMLKAASAIGNCVLKVIDIPNKIRIKRVRKRFTIKKESIIPEWVSEMVANDGHKYGEVHDKEWLQWNLDHNTFGNVEDIQSFYSVYDKNSKPLGFFMTKERLVMKAGPRKGIVVGTVVEWESCDKNVLNEFDLNILAIPTFSKKVNLILTLACESSTETALKKMGFVQRGMFYIGLKDKKKQFSDAGDPDLWRLRYGYTSMIIL